MGPVHMPHFGGSTFYHYLNSSFIVLCDDEIDKSRKFQNCKEVLTWSNVNGVIEMNSPAIDNRLSLCNPVAVERPPPHEQVGGQSRDREFEGAEDYRMTCESLG